MIVGVAPQSVQEFCQEVCDLVIARGIHPQQAATALVFILVDSLRQSHPGISDESIVASITANAEAVAAFRAPRH